MFECADIRTLATYTVPVESGAVESNIHRARLFANRMLFEVVDEDAMSDEGVRKIQRAEAACGGQMRIAQVPFRLHVYERELALVAVDFDDNAAGAYAVREPGLVRTFTALHARLWQQGRKWRDANRQVVDLADVLAELLAGGPDEACANHLGVSLRTYRRKVRELMVLLGARSRFEAGSIAEQRRYLELVRPEHVTEGVASAAISEALNRIR
jgi:hypothetical protein